MATSGSMVEIWGCNYIVFFRWFIWIPPHLTLGILIKRGSTVPRHIEIIVLSTTHVGIYWKLTTQYAASFETPSRESVVRVWIQIESWISSLGSFCLVLMKFLTPLFRLNMIEHRTVERPFELMAPKFTAKVAAFKQIVCWTSLRPRLSPCFCIETGHPKVHPRDWNTTDSPQHSSRESWSQMDQEYLLSRPPKRDSCANATKFRSIFTLETH